MKLVAILFLTAVAGISIAAQRPRAVNTTTEATKATPAPPPPTMKAKYEGGVFGHNQTMEGTLSFDDTNERLLFIKDGKEILFIPYQAVNSAFSDTQKKRPAAATVASNAPYYLGLPFGLIKTKVRYLTIQFDDPDTHVKGITSFRLENQGILDSALYALAQKSGLESRGSIYVRKRDTEEAKKSNP